MSSWSDLSKAYLENTADHPAVEGPGNSLSYYCDDRGGASRWLDDARRLRERQGHPDLHHVDVLALTLGTSFEPILLSIALSLPQDDERLSPVRVYLLHTRLYHFRNQSIMEGAVYARQLAGKVRNAFGDRVEVCSVPTHDSPSGVFEVLRARVGPHLREIAPARASVDVTGAKKSMSAGAFLFAAVTGVSLRYMDFAEYDPIWRRPVVPTCSLRKLDNPYEVFGLNRWRRVRDLYRDWNFEDALKEVRAWREAVKEARRDFPRAGEEQEGEAAEVFADLDDAALDRFETVIAAYRSWRDGDLPEARRQVSRVDGLEAPLAWPASLTDPEFQRHWLPEPAPTGGPEGSKAPAGDDLLARAAELEEYLTTEPGAVHLVRLYGREECARVRALFEKGQDYRSAFLRAHALTEFLLSARVAAAAAGGKLFWRYQDSTHDPSGDGEHQAMFNTDNLGATYLGGLVASGRKRKIERWRVATDDSGTELVILYFGEPFDSRANRQYLGRHDTTVMFDRHVKIRNKSIHTFLPVPKEVAEEAVMGVRANLADFEAKWCGDPGDDPTHSPSTWEDLCEVCGLMDFLNG